MNKKEKFVQRIKEQLNVDLTNDKEDIFNKKRDILYTEIEHRSQDIVLEYLIKNNIVYNKHYKDYFWIYL